MLWTYVNIHSGWIFKTHALTHADMVPYICLDFSCKGAPPGSVVDQKNLMLSLILPKSKKVKRKATPLLPEKLYRSHRTFKIKREFDEPPLSNPNNRVALETRHWLTIEDALTASGCVLLCYELATGYAEPQGRGEKWTCRTCRLASKNYTLSVNSHSHGKIHHFWWYLVGKMGIFICELLVSGRVTWQWKNPTSWRWYFLLKVVSLDHGYVSWFPGYGFFRFGTTWLEIQVAWIDLDMMEKIQPLAIGVHKRTCIICIRMYRISWWWNTVYQQ